MRNFELGVCVSPTRPSDLVEPLGDIEGGGPRSRTAWAQAIPFKLEQRPPCDDPFVHRALVRHREAQAEPGHLNY